MLKNYFKTALRNIAGQRLISVINIGGLAIAMTAVVIIALWVQNQLSFDNYHTDADRIYLLKNNWQIDKNPISVNENSFYPLAYAIEHTIPEAALATRMSKIGKDQLTLTVNGNRFKEETGINVDTNWFKVFKYSFIEGDASSFYKNPHSIIVTESEAKKLFGSTSIAGRQVQIDSILFSVAGVIKDNPANSSFQFNVLLPFYDADYNLSDWLYLRSKTFLKLKPNVNIASVEKKINAILQAKSETEGSITVSLLPLTTMHFENDFDYSAFKHINRSTIDVFSALAFLLLIAAAINYINLSIARTATRIKEMSIRKINGATRWHLFTQMMMESVITGFIAMLLTIVFAYACFPLLKIFSETTLVFNPADPVTIFILLGTLLGIILLTGIYPALLLSSLRPVDLFRGKNILGVKNEGFKKGLVVVQFALAVFMIIAAMGVYRQLIFIQNQNVAYNKAQVFTAQIPSRAFPLKEEGAEEKRESSLASLKQELLSRTAIKNVVRTDVSSLINENFTISNGIDWDGKPQNFQPEYISYSVDADMDSIMHFKMMEGRWFDKNSAADKKNVVLNETAVRRFGLREPVVGKRFNDGLIIGIVKDFFHQNLHEKIGPLVIRTGLPRSANFIIQAKPGKAKEALLTAQALWQRYFPGTFFEYKFADDEFNSVYKDDQRALLFTIIFSGLSILICCMGLLGITFFVTTQRTREIGIRKVLGATAASILSLLSKQFLKLVAISILIAAPFAWWAMHSWLQNYAYRISITWWMFVMAALITLVIAGITISVQTIKAAMANPVKSLRTE